MKPHRPTPAILLAGVLLPALAAAHDYPTADRVQYVLNCMADHGGRYQYLYQCSCAIDALARKVSYDDYVYMSTVVHAMHMGGERGGELRDPSAMHDAGRRYRNFEAEAFAQCGIQSARH